MTAIDETTEIPLVDTGDVVTTPDPDEGFRPTPAGWAARGLLLVAVAFVVLLLPHVWFDNVEFQALGTAVCYAIAGLSLNVLLGYTGTISLGHSAFLGVGAFTSAYVVTELEQPFLLGVAAAAAMGAIQGAVLGGLALRVTGLYFALVTLSYGLFAQDTLFGIESLTGGGAGQEAANPMGVDDFVPYYYVCLAFLAVVLWVDWRLMKSKGGRALLALRENPRVASTLGINVKGYLLLGFAIAGLFAGIGGSLFAHLNGRVNPRDFDLELSFVFVLMTVAGGLRNRTGIIISAAFVAMIDIIVHRVPGIEPALEHVDNTIPILVGLVSAGVIAHGLRMKRRPLTLLFPAILLVLAVLILTPIEVPLVEPHLEQLPTLSPEYFRLLILPLAVVVTLLQAPGGMGQQIRPIQRWVAGHRFDLHAGHQEEVQISDVRA